MNILCKMGIHKKPDGTKIKTRYDGYEPVEEYRCIRCNNLIHKKPHGIYEAF